MKMSKNKYFLNKNKISLRKEKSNFSTLYWNTSLSSNSAQYEKRIMVEIY